MKDHEFPANPRMAIERAFAEAERLFLEYAETKSVQESG